MMRKLKNLAQAILSRVGVYPNILFSFSPFKVIEFEESTQGVDFSSDDRVLDVGCGEGLQTFLLGKRCDRVVGIDTSEESIVRARQKGRKLKHRINSEFFCMELGFAGFEAESFDKVFSFCVIEHISNYRDVLHEIQRILKRNGLLVFSVDSLGTIDDPAAIEKHKREHSVERYFGEEGLRAVLTEIGFEDVLVYPIFKSDFARKLFLKGIENHFSFSVFDTIRKANDLRRNEKLYIGDDKGIFLVAKCKK